MVFLEIINRFFDQFLSGLSCPMEDYLWYLLLQFSELLSGAVVSRVEWCAKKSSCEKMKFDLSYSCISLFVFYSVHGIL